MKRVTSMAVLIMGLSVTLLGCDESAPMKSFPPKLMLETYKSTGDVVSFRDVGADDPVYQRLKSLLEVDRAGWKRSAVSYATGPYIFRAENITIRCYADAMVIDVVESGNSTSNRKHIPNLLQILGLPAN